MLALDTYFLLDWRDWMEIYIWNHYQLLFNRELQTIRSSDRLSV